MRTFAVGDVHGQSELLRRLLAQLRQEARPGDALVFLGDYIDRGPDSRGVIEEVLRQLRGAWDGPVTPLKGNHEAMMLDYLSDEPVLDPRIWRWNGGEETALSYTPAGWSPGWTAAIPSEHLRFLRELRPWHEDEHAIYVHAGIPPGKRPEECSEEELLWIREEFIEAEDGWGKVVVFGHTPQYEPVLLAPFDPARLPWRPLNRPEKIGLDTGAAYGGPLTAVLLPERRFFSVR